MDQGEVRKGHQNGTLENIRFFDYSWIKVKNIQSTGVYALANVSFEKQYSLVGFSVRYKGEPVKKIKRVTLSNVYTEAKFDLATGKMNYSPKGKLTITADSPVIPSMLHSSQTSILHHSLRLRRSMARSITLP